MSRKGFVDKNLFGLKDKLRSYQTQENTEQEVPVSSVSISEARRKQIDAPPEPGNNKEQVNKEVASSLSGCKKNISANLSSQTNIKDKNNEMMEKIKLPDFVSDTELYKTPAQIEQKEEENIIEDKQYFNALLERKKEFIHTRSDILNRINQNLEKLPADIERYEKQLVESKKIRDKLTSILENIKEVKEKEWDKKNFSLDLAKAMKKVENARLELFTIQQKTDYLLEDNIPGLEKYSNSFVPELTSLSVGQIFKLGTSFFLPLIIGLLLTGLLISIAMFIAMGVI